MADYALERMNANRPASSFTDAELRQVMESGLLRGGLVALEQTLKEQRQTIDAMREFNNRLSAQLTAALGTVRSQADYIEELCEAAWDVMPTLERDWKGSFPVPANHPIGALRAKLEENE